MGDIPEAIASKEDEFPFSSKCPLAINNASRRGGTWKWSTLFAPGFQLSWLCINLVRVTTAGVNSHLQSLPILQLLHSCPWETWESILLFLLLPWTRMPMLSPALTTSCLLWFLIQFNSHIPSLLLGTSLRPWPLECVSYSNTGIPTLTEMPFLQTCFLECSISSSLSSQQLHASVISGFSHLLGPWPTASQACTSLLSCD